MVATTVGLVGICVLATMDGGYREAQWYPAALFLLGLLVVTAVALPRGPSPPAPLVAVCLLGAYAAWNVLSVAWADDQGAALAGGGRAVMFATVFALFALWPLSGGSASFLVGGFGLAVAGMGLVELLRVVSASQPESFFIAKRLAEPMGYYNANAALWTAGLLPCALFASRREAPAILRSLFMAGAVVLLALALMAQSRGWFFSLPVVLVFFVAISPGRGRLVAALGLLGLAAWAMSGPVLDVYTDFRLGAILDANVNAATRAVLITAVCAGLLTGLVALLDTRLRLSPRRARTISTGVLALAVTAAMVGLAVLTLGGADRIDRAWEEFKAGAKPSGAGSRFTRSLGSGRYDFWRVSWGLFEDHPVLGVGADNFQKDYLVRGHTLEQPRWPHSVELKVLSETGIVGSLLLPAALLVAGGAILRVRRRGPPAAALASAAAVTIFVYWLVHGSVDWFWEFPALGATAFAMLGLAAGMCPGRGTGRSSRRGFLGRVGAGTGALALLASAVILLVPWLAELQVSRALDDWRSDPRAAYESLDRADDLNPLSSRPRLLAATIAVELGRHREAADGFRAALERDPRSHYAYLELGGLAAEAGRRRSALELFQRALRLAPRDRITARAIERTRAGERVTARQLGRELRDQGARLVTPG